MSLHGNLYFWIHESENVFCCIFSLFGSFHWNWSQEKNRWIESMYYFATEAGVKQKLCKVSVVEKNMNFTISETSGWLLRTSALKSHLLITYFWFYVGLANFPWKYKNYAGLGGCLLRWITSAFISNNSSYFTKSYQEPMINSSDLIQ